MHNGKLNNTKYDNSRKLMKQISFKVNNWGEWSQENNPLYQIEIHSQEYQFVVNLTKVTKLSYEPLKLIWCELAPTWISSSCFDLQYTW